MTVKMGGDSSVCCRSNGRGFISKMMKVAVVFHPCSVNAGRGKSKLNKKIVHGFHLVKGKTQHPMEDYHVAQFKRFQKHELGLFAIYDGHLGHEVPNYLQANLFNNIVNEHVMQAEFWTNPQNAMKKAYQMTDVKILENSFLGIGGSTAVTAILIDGTKLLVANVGDSRAVLSKNGTPYQLSVDHEPRTERKVIEMKGGFVTNIPGDVPRVDGQLAVARAFGNANLKAHLSSEPDITEVSIDSTTEFMILASDGLWKVMQNQEAIDLVKDIKDSQAAAKKLTEEALLRRSKDDISCIVVRFQ